MRLETWHPYLFDLNIFTTVIISELCHRNMCTMHELYRMVTGISIESCGADLPGFRVSTFGGYLDEIKVPAPTVMIIAVTSRQPLVKPRPLCPPLLMCSVSSCSESATSEMVKIASID
jgi:hypothetical protein